MKNRKKRIDPLIPALSAVAVILTVILAVLLFTEPKSGEGSGETVSPVQESSAPADMLSATDPAGQMTETTGASDATEVPVKSTAPTEEAPSAPPSQKGTEPEGTKTPEGTTDSEKTTEPTQGNTEPVMNGASVNTPYCVLQIPEEWVGRISVEIKEEEWNTAVAFYGEVSGERVLLYTLHFGGAAGDPVGILETEAGVMMDVTVEVHDITVNPGWSQEKTDSVYAMQESVNYMLENLGENRDFTPLDE